MASSAPSGFAIRRNATCLSSEVDCGPTVAPFRACCPAGASCPSQYNPDCCPSPANCTRTLLTEPNCANRTWTLYDNAGFFCCAPGTIGYASTLSNSDGCAEPGSSPDYIKLLSVVSAGQSKISNVHVRSREDLEGRDGNSFLGLMWFFAIVATVSSLVTSSAASTSSSLSHSSTAQSSQSRTNIAEPSQSLLLSQSPSPSPSGSASNTGAIAGGVVGGVAAIAIILSILLWVSRKRRNRFRSIQSHAGDRDKKASQTDALTRTQDVAEADGMARYELRVRPPGIHEADGMARHELRVSRRSTAPVELQ